MRLASFLFFLILLTARRPDRLTAQASSPPPAPPIADNSFLLEEAYNQEPGVVQHISALQRSLRSGGWGYTFTQEWPVAVQRHQVSFTVPVHRTGSGSAAATGVGDIALNYRYQGRGADARVALAPRLSVLLATGDETKGLGSGGLGLQVNVPVSVTVAPQFVTHWNAGLTRVPRAQDAVGAEAATTAYNVGASAIWLLRPAFNVVLEVVWARVETVTGPDQTAAEEALVVNPGVRWAHNFASGLQIVPGIAFPIGLGPSGGETAAFFYLSFEHSFRRRAP